MDRLCDSNKLVKLVCRCPGGKVRVRGAEDLIMDHYHVQDRSRAAVSVNAYMNDDLRNIGKCQADLRTWHYDHSVPWDESGYRMTHNSCLTELDDLYNKAQVEMSALVSTFLDNYERDLPSQKIKLGQLYDMVRFPRREHFRDRFKIERMELPVPSPGEDPRAGWSDDQKKEYQLHVEEQQRMSINGALINIASRISDEVGHVYEKTSGYTGAKRGAFRDSTIENCQRLADLIPALNINNDPTIEAIRVAINDKVCKYKPDEIRKDKGKLDEVRAASADILERIGVFSGARKREIGIDDEDDMIEMNVIV